MRLLLSALLLAALPAARARAAEHCDAANPNDDAPDDDALQACLDRGGEIALMPGSPGYIVRKGVAITRSGTRLTSASGADKAVLVAHPELGASVLAVAPNVNEWSVSMIRADGNRYVRTRGAECADGGKLGPTTLFQGRKFTVDRVEVVRTLCGSAMIVLGTDFEIQRTLVEDAGTGSDEPIPPSAPPGYVPWSDGMTVLYCERGSIHDNLVRDATDIALVVGGGADCSVRFNRIENVRRHVFAGLNVGNFNDNGRHTGSVFADNVITAELDKASTGLLVGAHPWTTKVTVHDAGSVLRNTVSGAVVNIAVDGAEHGLLADNAASGARGTLGWCAKHADYTAGDFGDMELQPGFKGRVYHDGACPNAGDTQDSVDAAFVSQALPRSFGAAQSAPVAVVFRNVGDSPWTAEAGDALVASAGWTPARVPLEPGETIAPGQDKVFELRLTAPSEPGAYALSWRMSRGGAPYGAPSPETQVTVTPPRSGAPRPGRPPAVIFPQSFDGARKP